MAPIELASPMSLLQSEVAAPALQAGKAGDACGKHGCWPSVYIVGAQKSATTSVFIALAQHNEICGRQNEKSISTAAKEAHFFDDPMDDIFMGAEHVKNEKALHKYLAGYPAHSCGGDYVDATPAYLRDLKVPGRMREAMPHSVIKHTKLIAILREPIARDLSYYNMFKFMWVQQGKPKHKEEDMGLIHELALCSKAKGFPSYAKSIGCQMQLWNNCMQCQSECTPEENIKAHKKCAYKNSDITKGYSRVTDGMYYAQINAYESVFPRHHMLVMSFDGLIDNQVEYMKAIQKFMGLNNEVHSIPDDNSASFSGKVHRPSCSTSADLQDRKSVV